MRSIAYSAMHLRGVTPIPPATRSTFNIACRVTAGSHIPRTERSPAVTSGHAGVEICIQEEHGGYGRIWPDTPSRRFGTVRPRVQIPGPRPVPYSKSTISGVVHSRGTISWGTIL